SQVTTPPSGSGTQPSTAALTDATDNVPAFTVTHADETKPSTASPDTDPEPESTAVPGTDGGVNTNPPVSSHPISESTYETNENGEIIDDYTSDLVFDTEDPDELYSMFGLSRSERQQFYNEISSKYELPIIHISTENEQEVLSKENYVNCLVEIFNCEDEYVMDATSAGIRVRGNASAFYGDED